MKKTEFIVCTEHSMHRTVWNRVYLGEDGNRYVKKFGRWINIEDKPCITTIMRSKTVK